MRPSCSTRDKGIKRPGFSAPSAEPGTRVVKLASFNDKDRVAELRSHCCYRDNCMLTNPDQSDRNFLSQQDSLDTRPATWGRNKAATSARGLCVLACRRLLVSA